MDILATDLDTLTELIDDCIEHFCDSTTSSGELAWTVTQCLASARLAELTGSI